MATRTPKTVKKVVNLMTNANPEFVSLVGHPANQTPFKAVKLDQNAVERIAQTEAQSELVRRSGIDQVEVHRFRFDKVTFKSEETVRSYLDARGWTDYSVNDDGKYFDVPNLGVEEFEGELEEIPAQKGITMTVGKVKNSAEPTQARKEVSPGTQAPVENTPKVAALEVVKKYDAWYAAWSNGKSLKDVMAEGYDGLPPGFWDIADAYVTAIRNNLISGDDNAIRSLGDEFNDVLMKLVAVFKHLTPEQVQKMTEKTTDTANTVPAKEVVTPPPATVPAGASTEKTPEQLAAEAVAPGTATTITDATPPVAKVPEMNAKDGSIAEVVAKSVRDALSSTLTDALKPLTAKVDNTAEVLTKLSARVDAVEAGQSQTRKSVSAEEVTPPGVATSTTTETPDPEKVARMARREKREREGMLGI